MVWLRSDWQIETFLESMEFITNQILLPLGGMFIAIFVGWFMKKSLITDEIGEMNSVLYLLWRFFVKFIAPLSVAYIFYSQFQEMIVEFFTRIHTAFLSIF